MKKPVGVALYLPGEQEPREISREELLALRAFDLVWWSQRERRFRTADSDVLRFLKEFRAGSTS